jgi:3-oxoacyl-[acyl-carrier protein] reductase
VNLGIEGKAALVTASSKGLGFASAAALAAEGAAVVITARREESLREAENAIRSSGGEVHAIVADVTEPVSPARLVDEAVARYGRLDILVANAGGPPPARALDVDDAQIEAAVNNNLTTSVRLVRAAVPHMRRERWGRICCITSYSIKQPIPTLALSNLARTGLWAWTKTAAADLFAEGITLNLACPGPHATDRMRELGGDPATMGDPADFGRAVAFLCSEPAGFISGAALNVDGAAVVGLL